MPLSVRFPRYRGRVWRSGALGATLPPSKKDTASKALYGGTINDGARHLGDGEALLGPERVDLLDQPVLPLAGRCKASSSSADPRSGRLAHGGTIAGGKDLQLRDGRGTKALLDDYATAKGTVSLSTADVHWWIFDDPRQASGGKQVPGPELYRKEKANCRHLT
jgi:hypothetical protein